MTRICLASAIIMAAAASGAALDNPVLPRAAARRAERLGDAATNRMERVAHVASQSVMAGQLVSRMTDGSVVVAPLKRAATARIPEALGRVRIDRALARIAAAVEGTDNDKVAKKLEQLADKLEKDNGKAKAAAAIGGALAAATAAYLASRKGRNA